MKIYLAGPEVFLPDAVQVGRTKQKLCRQYGFAGLFPLDNEIDASSDVPPSKAIFDGNIEMLDGADIVLANLTPYRAVSADVGTVFELGYAFARGKPVFGYSNSRVPFIERVVALVGGALERGPDGRLYARDRLAVEDFDRFDNLMIAEALIAGGANVILPQTEPADVWRDMGAFEETLRVIVARMATPPYKVVGR